MYAPRQTERTIETPLESIFTMDTSSIKYGPGATREIGHDMARLGPRRVLLLTDPNLAFGETVRTVQDALRAENIDVILYDDVRVEPTDASFNDAIRVATEGRFDGYVAVGGGSVIDTAKAANLYATHPADFLAYVNPPIGEGRPVPGPLKPLIAVPTTAGTGSETTGVAIFDLVEMHAKTGIAHRALRPTLGIVDPDNTRTLPPMVAACSGLDVLSHALESFTALPYHQRPAPSSPTMRPAYQGANPISDIWSERAIELVAANLPRAIADPSDDGARGAMMLAAAFAGIGFGNAGVHLPHGMSVILHAPAVVRFTAPTDSHRHLRAAALMGADTRDAAPDDAGDLLAAAIIDIMRQTGMPNGLAAVGFTPTDVDALVAGTLPQHRVTKLSPRSATESDLRQLFLASMTCW